MAAPADHGSTGSALHRVGWAIAAFLLYAILAEMLIEALRSGSPLRLWVSIILLCYAGSSVLSWKRTSYEAKAGFSALVLLILLGLSAWRLGSVSAVGGITAFRLSTSALATLTIVASLSMATHLLATLPVLPRAGRVTFIVLGLYCAIPFAIGLSAGKPLDAILSGAILPPWLPPWVRSSILGVYGLIPLAFVVALFNFVSSLSQRLIFQAKRLGFVSVAFALSFLLALPDMTSRPLEATSVPSSVSTQHLQALTDPANLSALFDSLDKLNQTMPRLSFDVAAKAAELGRDIDRTFVFVRDQVRYEVYEGVLRGPLGTLMALAGNSFDKSLLLGALLTQHGIEVRYVRGRLSEERAKKFLDQMFTEIARPVQAAPRTSVDRIPVEAVGAHHELLRAGATRWAASVDMVGDALRRGNIRWGQSPPASGKTLLDEAGDHLWLEYRSGDRWVALDPSATGARPGETFADAAETWTSVPPSRRHMVTIRVVVEERDSGRLTVSEVLRYQAAAADLNGATLTFTHRISSFGAGGWTAVPELQVEGLTITGETIAGGGMAGGARKLGRKIFGRPGEPPAQGRGELTAEWLEFDFTYPSGRTETVRRQIFDRIGPVARSKKAESVGPLLPWPAKGGIVSLLGGIYAASLSSGLVHPGFLLTRISNWQTVFRQALPILRELRQMGSAPTSEKAGQLGTKLRPILPQVLSFLAVSFHLQSHANRALYGGRQAWGDLWFYEATPRLAIASFEMTPTSDGAGISNLSIDLRRNDLRVVSQRMSGKEIVWASSKRGILDATLEHLLLSSFAPNAGGQSQTVSTTEVMTRARETGTPIVALTKQDAIERLEVPEGVKTRMIGALGDHAVLVAPVRPISVGGIDRVGWWRVDVESGETLGMMDSGLHQGAFEWIAEAYDSMSPIQQLAFAAFMTVVIIGALLAVAQALSLYVCLVNDPRGFIRYWQGVPSLNRPCP